MALLSFSLNKTFIKADNVDAQCLYLFRKSVIHIFLLTILLVLIPQNIFVLFDINSLK